MKNLVDIKTEQLEQAVKFHNLTTSYNIQGANLLSRKEANLKRWVEHFISVSNQKSTTDVDLVNEILTGL